MMLIISKVSDMIEEELHDAEKYARCAINNKDEYKALADVFYNLSAEEMKHVSLLHAQVTALIDEYRKEHGDPPERMMGIYEYLHKKHTEKAMEIKIMQGVYRGQ